MSDLSVFFMQNVETDITEEFEVSKRFKDAEGTPVPWKLRTMTEEENESIRKSAQKRVKVKGGQYTTETNNDEYLAKLAVASVVFPDLKDAELQRSYGVMGADKLLRKMLLPGEYGHLLEKVQEINGFDLDINDLKDEVKN
ncbi:phage portal protein [Brevibacillus brevis]|uniref:phage tail assembly chaperone n=1 Tax=Brevibacillus brevis TaxID=1393 RepID=UPI001900E510|nr:phage portal protein [Brevibacillus brevis]MBH0330130.1 phage portal protein [Brevibacillus brevis]